eukprot:CAMPEP_0177694256 /NCGR_PEP_ID=MMETSP0484_2-20121128/2837_1 /TAXON_ID=354590 /ORGANISM="Rhodomonas lens, Strain RHODO" /LENGTH=246 /DNA_ID=CAMNT_0019205123 /DNA_START=136 /DNA_END=873 /DNA_ORIENTATION=+
MEDDDAELQQAIAMSMDLLEADSEPRQEDMGRGREAGTPIIPVGGQRSDAAARDEALAMMLSIEDDQRLAETKKVLEHLVLNPADHPGEEKYCSIRKDNKKVAAVLQTPGAYLFLTSCGFVDNGSHFVLTHRNEGELRAAARSLGFLIDDQLADINAAGWDDGSAAPRPTPKNAHVPPRHFICDKCNRMVSNDNSRGGWGTSEGEFRYKCEHCADFSLCCSCFDALRAGSFPHLEGHTFEHIPPYE